MRKWRHYGLAILVFLLIMVFSEWLFIPMGMIPSDWTVVHNGTAKPIQIPYTQTIREPGMYTYRAEFAHSEGDALIIPRVDAYAMRVRVNGREIGQVGDPAQPTANIWNYSHILQIPYGVLEYKNRLEIELYCLHDTGIVFSPYVMARKDAAFVVDMQNMFTNGVALLMNGAAFTMVILLFLMTRYGRKRRRVHFYLGMSNLLFVLYNFEYIYRLTSGNLDQFLWIRKLCIVSVYVASLFLMRGMKRLVQKGFRQWYLEALLLLMSACILAMPDFYWLKAVVDWSNILLLVVFGYVMWLDAKLEHNTLHFPNAMLALSILQTVAVIALKIQMVYLLQVGIFTFLVGLSYTLMMQLAQVEREKDTLDAQIRMDALTGVNNRAFLEGWQAYPGDSFMFVDVDRFKEINDQMGHKYGDDILIQVAQTLRRHTRADDVVVRYGGDEFLVVFRRLGEEGAIERARTIAMDLEASQDAISISYGIIPFDGGFDTTLAKADGRMYEMKRSRKKAMDEERLSTPN